MQSEVFRGDLAVYGLGYSWRALLDAGAETRWTLPDLPDGVLALLPQGPAPAVAQLTIQNHPYYGGSDFDSAVVLVAVEIPWQLSPALLSGTLPVSSLQGAGQMYLWFNDL